MTAALWLSVAVPVLLGAASGYATRGGVQSAWYRGLDKPSWMPPGYVFGPVWTVLYVLMGIACWRVWGSGTPARTLYVLQLALNLAWSFLFFNAKNLEWALIDIWALLAVLIVTTRHFYAVDHTAGYLMVPYLAWVAFATALTTSLYIRN